MELNFGGDPHFLGVINVGFATTTCNALAKKENSEMHFLPLRIRFIYPVHWFTDEC